MSKKSIVYLVEDDQEMRKSVAWMLRARGFDVAAFGSPDELLESFSPTTPACLVLDWHLPGMTGLELQQRMVQRGCHCPFIIITGDADVSAAVESMREGAVDFLEKPFRHATLVQRISEAIQRDAESRRQQAEWQNISNRLASLTQREQQVMRMVVDGKLTKQIAKQLGISTKTVEVHRSHITKKMRVKSVPQLVRMMMKVAVQDN